MKEEEERLRVDIGKINKEELVNQTNNPEPDSPIQSHRNPNATVNVMSTVIGGDENFDASQM